MAHGICESLLRICKWRRPCASEVIYISVVLCWDWSIQVGALINHTFNIRNVHHSIGIRVAPTKGGCWYCILNHPPLNAYILSMNMPSPRNYKTFDVIVCYHIAWRLRWFNIQQEQETMPFGFHSSEPLSHWDISYFVFTTFSTILNYKCVFVLCECLILASGTLVPVCMRHLNTHDSSFPVTYYIKRMKYFDMKSLVSFW